MKKFLLSLAVSAVTVSTALCSASSLAKAADNTPRIYIDLVYKTETQIRANIMFENMPETCAGGFHLNISDGWSVREDDGSMYISTLSNYNTQYLGIHGDLFPNDHTKAFIYYSSKVNRDPNGCFCSFDIEKTASYSETNANISAYFTSYGNNYDCIASGSSSGSGKVEHFAPGSNEPIKLPIITRVAEYRIGDTDANGRVNASDATDVMVALDKNGDVPIKVSQIENNFKTFFPNATAPAAGDANCDGIISMDDVYYILENYSSSSTGGGYIGSVGSKAIYEYYNC